MTAGRSLYHIRLFPLYIKSVQAHYTRFNKLQKQRQKHRVWQKCKKKTMTAVMVTKYSAGNLCHVPLAIHLTGQVCSAGGVANTNGKLSPEPRLLNRGLSHHNHHTNHCPSLSDVSVKNRKSFTSTASPEMCFSSRPKHVRVG